MQLNELEIVDRHDRPNLSSKTGLRVFFFNDGQLTDPVGFSGVTLFQKSANITPNSILDSNGLISSSVAVSDIKAHFRNINGAGGNTGLSKPATDYTGIGDSGIFKISTGEYIVVLDGGKAPQATYDFHGASVAVTATTDVATDYIDVWTVKLLTGSDYKTIINEFTLFSDTFYTVTEPILLKAHPQLRTKYVTLGSKTDLKITNDITVENAGLTEEIKNIFKHNVITNPQIKIEKINEGHGFPSRVGVLSYTDTENLINVTSDNTLVFNWDPETSKDLDAWDDGTFGTLTGPYHITVKYTLLNQTYVSPPFTVIVS
jgi:hypothetical protein